MNILDRLIGYISPRRAYERQAWRDAARNYDSGDNGRLNAGWTAVNASAEQTNQPYRDTIRARARDLERNSDIAEAIISPFERNVVGTGIIAQAKVRNSKGEEDERTNQKIEEVWNRWQRKENCDITGQQSFSELQAMAIRRVLVDGGIIFVKCYVNGRFCLQAREVDDLDTSYSTVADKSGNAVVNGIELDQYRKPVAYYLKKYTPDGYWAGESEKIPASRIIYLWKKQRPTQVREISQLAKTIGRVRDVNEFVEAVSVKERILACLAVFITKLNPGRVGRSAITDPQSGYRPRTVSPGMIHELQPGEEIQAVSPSGSGSSSKDFISTQQRLAGGGQGLSYEAVSRDMSQVNYSSARQGLLEDQGTYKFWQKFIVENLCRPVYEEAITSAVLNGELRVTNFFSNKEKYLAHEWIPPGWSWIDPLKEVKANETALNTGMDTLSRICAERGLDWRDVLKQRAKEQEYAKELGLTLGGDNGVKQQISTQNGDTGQQNGNQS